LGIPTVADRIAQEVVKRYLEPIVEPIFHEGSYGYRPGRSAIDTVRKARQRCWRYDSLPMGASLHRTLVEGASTDGGRQDRAAYGGNSQGGVVSPCLANLFLHYVFDMGMVREFPDIPFERYADDLICHCRSAEEARALWNALEARFAACRLVLHSQKTKLVYCKDANRRGDYPIQSFDFLGYEFRPRSAVWHGSQLGVSFLPAASPRALKAIRQTVRRVDTPSTERQDPG